MSIAIKKALRDGRVQIGTFLFELSSPSVPRLLANAGFDFVVVDMEHGIFTLESAATLIAAAKAAGIVPLVRVPEITRQCVLGALEAGAGGIVAPMVRNAQDVDRLHSLANYPPIGERGACFGTAHTDYRIPDPAAYLRDANEAVLLVGQIETRDAVANLDEILSAGKLDVAFVGPLDLSVDLGALGDQSTPEFKTAMDTILDRCEAHGVVPGGFVSDPKTGREWIERGFRMIACSGELFMLGEKSREIVEGFRRA